MKMVLQDLYADLFVRNDCINAMNKILPSLIFLCASLTSCEQSPSVNDLPGQSFHGRAFTLFDPETSINRCGTVRLAMVRSPDYAAISEDYAKREAERAKQYFNAAEQGDAIALSNIMRIYYENDSSRGYRRPAEAEAVAVKWCRRAAEQGDAIAQSHLGLMCENGRGGVAEDDVEAVRWYRKAAEQGNGRAQFNLGLMYFSGEGVPVDYVAAYMWWNLAAAQGIRFAEINKGIVSKSMTKEQIAEARELSREWLTKHLDGWDIRSLFQTPATRTR
jgi:TPR repeat protein